MLGVTGSGKTYTMAKVIEKVSGLRWCWPTIRHWQPSSARNSRSFSQQRRGVFCLLLRLLPAGGLCLATDTYIAKDASTNDEIDRLRLSATCALLERGRDRGVLRVLHYGLGEPDDFAQTDLSAPAEDRASHDVWWRTLRAGMTYL